MKKTLSIIGLALILAACGGSDNDDHANGGGSTPPPPPPVSMIDAFFTTVNGIIAMLSESTEPQSTDALSPTAPEDSEPATVS